MNHRSANSLFNSLQGKIRLAAAVLAFFVCSFGLICYLLISFFIGDTIFAILVPLLLVSLSVLIFGWWLSNELTSPIERVSLLAKSLERSANVSLPKTTGWIETDEILETLHRSSQQMQTVVGLMDAVAAGNTNVALTPLENSDRLSGSFQKLLAKVSDSIDAKQKLEKLESAISEISEETALVRRGNLDADVKTEHLAVKDVAETLEFLLSNLNELISQIRKNSGNALDSAAEAEKIVLAATRAGENEIAELNEISFMLAQMPVAARKMHDELAVSVSSAEYSIEKAKRGAAAAQANLQGVDSLRQQMQDAIKKIGNLGEHSHEITKIAKSIEDLARRTNLIALNASIRAAEAADKNQGFSVLAEEIERLARRAEKAGKEISSLNQSVAAEIGEIENSLRATVGDAAHLSRFAVETGDALGELEKYVSRFLNLQAKLTDVSIEQTAEIEKTLRAFAKFAAAAKKNINDLKHTETHISAFTEAMDKTRSATANFTLPEKNIENVSEPPRQTSAFNAEIAEEFENVVTI